MFVQYFGKYLVENNIISQPEYELIIKEQENSRVKLGFIAVAERLLTKRQAEELNELQKTKDQRFGDLAIEKGYLLEEELNYLLNMQGNPYMKFIQTLTEESIMTMDEIEDALRKFSIDSNFSSSDLDDLLSNDIDRILPVFIDVDVPIQGECISLFIRNIIRLIDNNIMVKKAYSTKEYSFGNLAYQKVVGDYNIFVGLASQDDELLTIANPFARENFTVMNEDSFDSVCEFINCINGLYASKLSLEEINVDMTPPLYQQNKTISSSDEIYVVPIIINNKQSDLLFTLDSTVNFN